MNFHCKECFEDLKMGWCQPDGTWASRLGIGVKSIGQDVVAHNCMMAAEEDMMSRLANFALLSVYHCVNKGYQK